MRRKLCLLVVLGLAVAVMPAGAGATNGPTYEEVRTAIADGVDWLADQQADDGYWSEWETCAITGLAVKKFEHHAVDPVWGLGLPSPFDDAYPYKMQVEKGLNYLLEHCAGTMDIVPQPAGDPDSDGDGLGVYFGTDYWHRTYTSGIALMAMCEVAEFDRIVEAGPLAGWTYGEVARDLMDYLAFGQNDAGTERGGWGYYDNYTGWSDNSNAGYATLGLGFAEAAPPLGCGYTVPQFVKDELAIWIDYVQNDVDGDSNDGGSGYQHPDSWVNILKTGNLLQQMDLVGDDAGTSRVLDALDYLERHWNDLNNDPGWQGSPANYQATFTVMKGLTSLGIGEFGGIDWVTDFETVLLSQQNPDGSWPHTDWDYGPTPVLSTIWALLTLQRVAPPPAVPIDIKPTSCPNPFNVDKKGVMPVAILGTGNFDVTQIDPATVTLEGVAPLRWAYEDVATPFEPYLGKEDAYDCNEYGPDGYMDLTLKFEAQEIAAALGEVYDGDVLVLSLTGFLMEEFGGTPFVGEDVIVILKKK